MPKFKAEDEEKQTLIQAVRSLTVKKTAQESAFDLMPATKLPLL